MRKGIDIILPCRHEYPDGLVHWHLIAPELHPNMGYDKAICKKCTTVYKVKKKKEKIEFEVEK